MLWLLGLISKFRMVFFVDNVLVMCMLNHLSWLNLFHIFKRFKCASGLVMHLHKSMLYHDMGDMDDI